MAGNINPTPNLNLNQQASFQVLNPTQAANNLLNNATALEQTNRRNFQSGLNNAITQAAAIQRQQQSDRAQMERQLEAEAFKAQQLAAQQAFARQSSQAAAERQLKKELTSTQNFSNIIGDIAKNSSSVGEAKARAKLAFDMINSQSQQLGIENNPVVEDELNALESIFNPGENQTSVADTGDNFIRQAGDDTPLSGGIESAKPDFDLSQGIFDSIERRVKTQQADLDVKSAKADTAQKEVQVIKEQNNLRNQTKEAVLESTSEEGRLAEEAIYANLDRERAALQGEKDFKKDRKEFIGTSRELKPLGRVLNKHRDAIRSLEASGLDFDPSALSAVRAIVETVGDSEADAVQEVTKKIKFSNVFSGESTLSEAQQKKLFNDYLIAEAQLQAKGSRLAKLGGETGNLSNPDVTRAISQFQILGVADSETYLQNLQTGLDNLYSGMTQQAYFFDNMGEFSSWRRLMSEQGLEFNIDGLPTRSNGISQDPLAGFTDVGSVPISNPEEEVAGFAEASEAKRNLFLKLNSLGQ